MKLEESTFTLFAAKHYDNPHCEDIIEFEQDLKRFQHLRKLFTKYRQTGELKERLILNHLVIIYNCFGTAATPMLFMKLEEYADLLKPFVEYLNFLPQYVEYNGKVVLCSSIVSQSGISNILQRI